MQPRAQTGGRSKAYLFLGVSLVAAVLAAVLVVNLLKRAQKQVEQARQPSETIDVVVATRNLYMGLPIQEGDVAVRALAPEMVPADVVFTSIDQTVGRTPKERILASEIVRSERLARREAGIGLNAVITPGKRAISIAVKAEEAVAGFVNPLNYVDVIVVIKPDDRDAAGTRAISKTLLQEIKVLAVGDTLGGAGSETTTDSKGKTTTKKKKSTSTKGKRTITLEVTLEEAEQISLASAKGDIVLALRADIDITQVETHGAKVDALVGLAPKEDAPLTTMAVKRTTGPKEGPKAEVVSGGDTIEVEFNADGTREESNNKKKRR
ncbi:MAG: Flp pilus assembly protein CpaB [Proteobacteria bacterium]|nr:Flp pilus assembly protein CpaB [Pseudomonadota bacterium]MCP4921412.1 Flp pilus assembly protein CpaB [Pseudomonadota bacterium]